MAPIFDGCKPMKMAAQPCATLSLPKNPVFQQADTLLFGEVLVLQAEQ